MGVPSEVSRLTTRNVSVLIFAICSLMHHIHVHVYSDCIHISTHKFHNTEVQQRPDPVLPNLLLPMLMSETECGRSVDRGCTTHSGRLVSIHHVIYVAIHMALDSMAWNTKVVWVSPSCHFSLSYGRWKKGSESTAGIDTVGFIGCWFAKLLWCYREFVVDHEPTVWCYFGGEV